MPADAVTLVVPGPLQFFLPAKHRGAEQVLPADGTSTVGHLLASLGVPRTEVGELRAGGVPVPLSYRPAPGDRIEVAAARRPQAAPTSPPRFVLDVHLGTLARRLRLLGLDTAYAANADDDELLETSLREQRILLTRDRGLLHRRALRWGAHVNTQVPDDQLREVLARFAPPLAPGTRCPSCNGELHAVPKTEVESLLRPGTRRSYETFHRCAACGQVYWDGAHGTRLRRIVDAATG
ncbi:Mut7-C RNAse domain-containing protein [Nocardioides pantholopis]|uniref:Mut7-C RNAse domain-containing protein n=1 Tax=Nocardioides pantholopis TaxID=2483798 RepID=UPI000F089197|nr:Mut7-C RNAse domain-containing protein [Nocardioides pantholopis]